MACAKRTESLCAFCAHRNGQVSFFNKIIKKNNKGETNNVFYS